MINDDYIDGGRGYCTDGSGGIAHTSDLPCFSFPSTNYSECEAECTKLDKCIAFGIHVDQNCQLRFASKDALLAQPNPSGYRIWWNGGCENNCKTNYAGRGTGPGRCWVKRNGNLVELQLHLKLLSIY